MNPELVQQFQQLSTMLQQYRDYWQISPFRCQQLPWQGSAVAQRISALSEDELKQLDSCDKAQRDAFADLFPALFALPASPECQQQEPLPPLPFWLKTGIGGRKLQQIAAMCQHWPDTALPVLEWCAGKGHLGRILAHRFNLPVTSVEWQPLLCTDGAALAQKHGLSQQFICADVLAAPLQGVLQARQHLVALHACGQLHITMLQQAVQAQCQHIQLVPCCYHLIATEQYQPMSALAALQPLVLYQDDLKLVVQGQVTAGERVEKLRTTEVLWRLAYDELRCDISGDCHYRPLASVAKQWFSRDFAGFAQWAAAQHQLTLPQHVDWQCYLQRGARRAAMVRRIELVRHLFRRPLEWWLMLDKALYLQQHGYQTQIKALCDYQITPRNFLLQARKAG
jgi:hypothetical protein